MVGIMKRDLTISRKKQIMHQWRGYVTHHKLVGPRRYVILGVLPHDHSDSLCTLIYLTSVNAALPLRLASVIANAEPMPHLKMFYSFIQSTEQSSVDEVAWRNERNGYRVDIVKREISLLHCF